MRTFLIRGTWVLLLAFFSSSAAGQSPHSPEQLTRQIGEILNAAPSLNASWGIFAKEAEGQDVLYRRNARKSFIPASNAKLYVTAAALEQLGPDYRYETSLYAQGPVRSGILQGNLIVRGSGDPTISGRFHGGDRTAVFEEWAFALQEAGIQSVEGDVIGDDDVFDDTPLGEGWSWNDLPFWYAAATSGLSFNDNTVDLTVRSQRVGMPAEISWRPYNTDYIQVRNATRTVPARAEYDEEYLKKLGTNTFTVGSLLPVGDNDNEALAVTNPTLYFVHVFRESLLRNGVAVSGQPVDVDALSLKPDYSRAGALRTLATYTSPPLSEIVDVTNTRSQNLFAEQLLKTLGARRPLSEDDLLFDEELTAGSAEMGVAVARETFARAGIDTSRINLVDGSGLSRKDLVTPRMTVQLLRYMWNHEDREVASAFYQSLPVAGVSGTLRYRLDRGLVSGNVRAKTGSLSHVSALSGYVETAGGRLLAFSIMCNSFTADSDEIEAIIDAIVALLARYRG